MYLVVCIQLQAWCDVRSAFLHYAMQEGVRLGAHRPPSVEYQGLKIPALLFAGRVVFCRFGILFPFEEGFCLFRLEWCFGRLCWVGNSHINSQCSTALPGWEQDIGRAQMLCRRHR